MKICEEYASLLDPFIDGELGADEATRVREHLACCPACAAYAGDAMAIRAAFDNIDEIEVPDGLADGVMAAIRAHGRDRSSVLPNRRCPRPAFCCGLAESSSPHNPRKFPVSLQNTSPSDPSPFSNRRAHSATIADTIL